MVISPVASVGVLVKVHPRTHCSSLPEKGPYGPVWQCVSHPLTAVLFPFFYSTYEEKWCLGFRRKDSKTAEATSPVTDRSFPAQEGRQRQLLRSLLGYPHPHSLFTPEIFSSSLLPYALFSEVFPPPTHLLYLSSFLLFLLTALFFQCALVFSLQMCMCVCTLPPKKYILISCDWGNGLLSEKVQCQ